MVLLFEIYTPAAVVSFQLKRPAKMINNRKQFLSRYTLTALRKKSWVKNYVTMFRMLCYNCNTEIIVNQLKRNKIRLEVPEMNYTKEKEDSDEQKRCVYAEKTSFFSKLWHYIFIIV